MRRVEEDLQDYVDLDSKLADTMEKARVIWHNEYMSNWRDGQTPAPEPLTPEELEKVKIYHGLIIDIYTGRKIEDEWKRERYLDGTPWVKIKNLLYSQDSQGKNILRNDKKEIMIAMGEVVERAEDPRVSEDMLNFLWPKEVRLATAKIVEPYIQRLSRKPSRTERQNRLIEMYIATRIDDTFPSQQERICQGLIPRPPQSPQQ